MYMGYSRPGPVDVVKKMLSKMDSEGYHGLQLKANQYGPWLDESEAFRRNFDISKCMGVVAHGMDEALLKKTFSFAGELGLQAVSWMPSWKKGQFDYAPAAEILNRFGKYAREAGTKLSVHNHAGQIFDDKNALREFCNLVQPEYIGLTLDTAHLALSGVKDIRAVIRECKDHIYLFHIKDLRGTQWCPLGQGELRFDEIFQAIRDIGFDGWLVVDDESDLMTLGESIPYAAEFMRKHM